MPPLVYLPLIAVSLNASAWTLGSQTFSPTVTNTLRPGYNYRYTDDASGGYINILSGIKGTMENNYLKLSILPVFVSGNAQAKITSVSYYCHKSHNFVQVNTESRFISESTRESISAGSIIPAGQRVALYIKPVDTLDTLSIICNFTLKYASTNSNYSTTVSVSNIQIEHTKVGTAYITLNPGTINLSPVVNKPWEAQTTIEVSGYPSTITAVPTDVSENTTVSINGRTVTSDSGITIRSPYASGTSTGNVDASYTDTIRVTGTSGTSGKVNINFIQTLT